MCSPISYPANHRLLRRDGKTVMNVHVLIDHAALVRGSAIAGETCTIPGVGPVNVAWVREMLGDAFVTAMIKKGRDIACVAHFGRHIPAHLRTAMIVGGRECVVAGCNARGDLEIDHSDVDFRRRRPRRLVESRLRLRTTPSTQDPRMETRTSRPKTGKRTLTAPAVPATVSRR
jgi:hypothetical protein